MFKLLGGLKEFLKKEEIVVDGPVFRFHNVFTAVLLFGCSILVTATQYVGTPIQCIVEGLPTHPVNTFCWIMSTFTMPGAFAGQVGTDVAHPGVGPDYGDENGKKYYTYYQWVCFVLFFQGVCCYLPKWLWDNSEGGLMKTLVLGLNHYIYTEKEKVQKKQIIVNYVLQHLKRHRMYAIRYWCCEFLCLLNVLLQMYAMNRFFDGEFLNYGFRVMEMSDELQEKRVDPMIYIFPRVTKCTFHKYGPTGTLQTHDSMCVLPLNIVNEKTYILIWFWFVSLAAVLTLLLLYRLALIGFPSIRRRLLKISRKIASRHDAKVVTYNLDVGDWWVLYMLGKNLDPAVYNEIVVDLAKKMEDPNSRLRR